MSLIVAGRFQTFEKADEAAHHLIDDGFLKDDVNVFYVNPPGQHATYPTGGDVATDRSMHPATYSGIGMGTLVGAIIGAAIGYGAMNVLELNLLALLIMAAVGAYLGSLIGTMIKAKTAGEDPALPVSDEMVQEPVRESGVLLAVHVTEQSQHLAEDDLRESGAREVEHASGNWTNGKWADFNPVSAPVTVH